MQEKSLNVPLPQLLSFDRKGLELRWFALEEWPGKAAVFFKKI